MEKKKTKRGQAGGQEGEEACWKRFPYRYFRSTDERQKRRKEKEDAENGRHRGVGRSHPKRLSVLFSFQVCSLGFSPP